jgi:hypothetical protein
MATRKPATPTRGHAQNQHAAVDVSAEPATRSDERPPLDGIEELIKHLRLLGDSVEASDNADNQRPAVTRNSRQVFVAPHHSRRSGSVDRKPPAMATARTRLNPTNLPIGERAAEISTQLVVLEHLFQAAREKGSGAVPLCEEADWDDFWLGLERIVRQVRMLAEDIYEQGQIEGG